MVQVCDFGSMGIAAALHASFVEVRPAERSWREPLPAEWIEEALAATGTASVRRRRLPAEQVLWLVLGMALMRERSLRDIVRSLDLALPGPRVMAASAVVQGRERLGSAPVKALFERTAAAWTTPREGTNWRGLELFGVDGTTMDVADTPENRAHFVGQNGPVGQSPYPMLRMVILAQLRTHLIRAAVIAPYTTGEARLALELRDKIPDHSLTIFDRLFHGAELLYGIERSGTERHWLRRALTSNVWKRLRKLGAHDEIVSMKFSSRLRAVDKTLPEEWIVRAITYVRNGKKHVLLTSMLDPKRYPAKEIVSLYEERWELEVAYKELKVDLHQRREVLRSKSVKGVEQEVWGALLAYNLVRLEMRRVADKIGVAPTRISFTNAMRLIRDEWMWSLVTSPGALPSRLLSLEANLAALVLPERRKRPRYPRALKNPVRGYPRKPRTTAVN